MEAPSSIRASVVIATYNRLEALLRLLSRLALQSLDAASFEVVVVDDGSVTPVEPPVRTLKLPYALRCVTQVNGGAAAARHAGVLQARGEVIVILDDDMDVPEHFLEAHLAEHRAGESIVVLGHIRPAPAQERLASFERYHAQKIDALADDFRTGRAQPRGVHLYTGNVSLRRADYLRVGGLDAALRRSEDIELGVRLEEAGARFVFAPEAYSVHHSDHSSAVGWRKSTQQYGHTGLRIAHKHPARPELHPYHFLGQLNPLSLPWLGLSLLRPKLGERLAAAGLAGASMLDRLRLGPVAVKATGFVHALDYFSGVSREAGSTSAVFAEGLKYLAASFGNAASPRLLKWLAVAGQELEADYAIALESRPSYAQEGGFKAVDLVHRIGLQMMVAYRLMQAFRRADQLLAAKVLSRLIRHVYGADIHWDAELAGGVHIVHGMGLAISGRARVGSGSVLSQHVTLGNGLSPTTRASGSPTLGKNVHVGPGATLIGPITIGDGSKIMPGALVQESVPPGSIVEVPRAVVRPRKPHAVTDDADQEESA